MAENFVKCHRCGSSEVIAYASEATAICPNCCDDHNFMYDRHERWWSCDNCGVAASYEWMSDRAAS